MSGRSLGGLRVDRRLGVFRDRGEIVTTDVNRGSEMKKTIAWVTLIAAATFLASVSTVRAECVSQSLLTWVDNREANAISPARWQAVRNSLLERDGGMPLADMQVIYDRRVRNGWSAGHWVPILSAMNCLAEQPEPEPEQVEEQPAQAAKAEVEPAQETTADLSQPPEDFRYFNTTIKDAIPIKIKKRIQVDGEWVWGEVDGTDDIRAWNKWGPWARLSEEVRKGIHAVSDKSWATLANEAYPGQGFYIGDTPPMGNSYRWQGDFKTYELHPNIVETHRDPRMVIEFNARSGEWIAAVDYEYKRDGSWGQRYYGDTWEGLDWRDGFLHDPEPQDGLGYDGLRAGFFSVVNQPSPWLRKATDSYIVGDVRRPKIIGSFVTETGKVFYPPSN